MCIRDSLEKGPDHGRTDAVDARRRGAPHHCGGLHRKADGVAEELRLATEVVKHKRGVDAGGGGDAADGGAIETAVSYTHLDVYKRQGLRRPPHRRTLEPPPHTGAPPVDRWAGSRVWPAVARCV